MRDEDRFIDWGIKYNEVLTDDIPTQCMERDLYYIQLFIWGKMFSC